MQKLAKEATSNARIKALNVQKVTPKPSKNLINQVEKLLNQAKKQAETQKNTVNILLNKTVRNAKWKAKQTQLMVWGVKILRRKGDFSLFYLLPLSCCCTFLLNKFNKKSCG
jgi:hypothetical protein